MSMMMADDNEQASSSSSSSSSSFSASNAQHQPHFDSRDCMPSPHHYPSREKDEGHPMKQQHNGGGDAQSNSSSSRIEKEHPLTLLKLHPAVFVLFSAYQVLAREKVEEARKTKKGWSLWGGPLSRPAAAGPFSSPHVPSAQKPPVPPEPRMK
jgi:hypothetical protein